MAIWSPLIANSHEIRRAATHFFGVFVYNELRDTSQVSSVHCCSLWHYISTTNVVVGDSSCQGGDVGAEIVSDVRFCSF